MKWYAMKKEYINFLKTFDNKVPNIEYGINKLKPFIGIVYQNENIKFYCPITSFKPKFLKIKDNIDFMKIWQLGSNSILGAIDINNMIPVPDSELIEITYSNLEMLRDFVDAKEKDEYWNFLKIERDYILLHKERLMNNATALYRICTNNPTHPLNKRCCDYGLLES